MGKEKRERNIDFEIEFFEKLLSQKDNFVEVMIPLAEAYTKKGEYDKGLELDKKLSEIKPNDPTIVYNLACSYSLMSMIDESFNALERAILSGYSDFGFMDKDSDLDNIRQDPRYLQLKKKYANIRYGSKWRTEKI